MFISNNYRYWMINGLLLNSYALLGLTFYLDESPLWLLKKGYKERAEKVILRMMRINGLKNPEFNSKCID